MDATLFPSKTRGRQPFTKSAPPASWSPIAPGTVILCIDPSVANCGWAIVRNMVPSPERIDSGIFHPVAREAMDRYDHLSELIGQRIELSEIVPTHALIEVPAGGQWSRSATQLMVYARAIGVCEATCHMLGLKVMRATVNEWKGSGKKSHTNLCVKASFKYEPRDSNEADALGLGLWICGRTPRSKS